MRILRDAQYNALMKELKDARALLAAVMAQTAAMHGRVSKTLDKMDALHKRMRSGDGPTP